MSLEKEYTGTFILGATTPTYDLESKPENFADTAGISASDVKKQQKVFLEI